VRYATSFFLCNWEKQAERQAIHPAILLADEKLFSKYVFFKEGLLLIGISFSYKILKIH